MTETMTRPEAPEVFGTYINNEPTNVVRESDHTRIVAERDDRIVALQNLNETKVQTIQDLREEVERAQRSEGIEVQRSAEARAEIEAMKRQAVELANGRDMYKRMYGEVREEIANWANENDLDREFVNTLLEALNMEPLPEYVEAEIEVRVTVRFQAGAGVPSKPDAAWLNGEVEVGAVEIRPAWSSSLTVEEISTDSHDVIGVVAH